MLGSTHSEWKITSERNVIPLLSILKHRGGYEFLPVLEELAAKNMKC